MDIETLTQEVKNLFYKKGYRIKEKQYIIGNSGIKHFSDLIIVDKKGKNIISVYVSNILNSISLINMFARIVDTKTTQILIAKKLSTNIIEEPYELPAKIILDLEQNIYIAFGSLKDKEKADILCDILSLIAKKN